MLRLFTSLYFGIIATFFILIIAVQLLESYAVADLDNVLISDRLTSEVQLLEQIVDSEGTASIEALLTDIANNNHFIIETIAEGDIAPDVLAELAHRKVWFDEDDYLYIKAFTPARFYQVSENEQSQLITLIDTIDTYAILSIFIVFALMSLGWLWGLMKKLQHLELVTDKFSHGDFSARASSLGRHQVGRLNQRFNDMAQRIEHLIAAQKQQTQMVAHELRSPLFRLHLQLDLLEQSEKDQQAQHIQGIEDDICHLEELVNELLEYGKVFRAELSLNFQPTIIHSFINDIYRVSLKDSTAKVTLDNHIDSKLILPIDSHYFTRAIVNLLTNANKYAKSQICLTSKIKGNDFLLIVEDDGCGVAVDDQEKIFQPYFRSEQNNNQKGYGLGLPICQEVLRLHQGNVSVEDSELGGAKFTISMPIKAH